MSKFVYRGKDRKFAARFAGGGEVPITGTIQIGRGAGNGNTNRGTSVTDAGTFSTPASQGSQGGGGGGGGGSQGNTSSTPSVLGGNASSYEVPGHEPMQGYNPL